MNCQVLELKETELEPFQIKEVLRCFIHTVLFNRALGDVVVPLVADCAPFDITYCRIDSADRNQANQISNRVEKRIKHFYEKLMASDQKRGVIGISFYSEIEKQGWFSSTKEKSYWERWLFPVSVAGRRAQSMADRNRQERLRRDAVSEGMLDIIKFVNEKRNHLPAVTKGLLIFPFELPCHIGDPDSRGVLNNIKQAFKQGPAMLMK